MNRLKKPFIVSIVFSSFFLGVSLFLFISSSQSKPSYEIRNFSNFGKIYFLRPLDFSSITDSSSIKYSQVDVSPADKSYQKEIKKEEKLIRLGKEEPFNFASKRIVELFQWGNQLKIKGNLDFNQETLEFDSWEYLVKRYVSLAEKQKELIDNASIPLLDKKEKLSQLYGRINYDYQNLLQLVSTTGKSTEEKQYLVSLLNSSLLGKLNEMRGLLFPYDPYKIIFSINELDENNDLGGYKVTLPLAGLDYNESSPLYFSVNNSTISGVLKKNSFGQRELDYGDVTISDGQNILSLVLPKADLLGEQPWNEIKSEGGDYDYSVVLPTVRAEKYLLSFKVDFPADVNFKLEGSFFDNISNLDKTAILLGNSWIYFNKDAKGVFTQVVPIQKRSPSYTVKITFRSKQKLDIDIINKMSLQWIAIYEPRLQLEKVNDFSKEAPEILAEKQKSNSYLITVKNANKDYLNNFKKTIGVDWKVIREEKKDNDYLLYLKKKSTQLYSRLVELFLLLFFVVILRESRLFNQIISTKKAILSKEVSKLKKKLIKLSESLVKVRWLFLLIFLFVFVLGMVYGKNASNKLYTTMVILWFFCIWSWKFGVRLSLSLSVVLLFLCAVFRAFRQTNMAEWAAIWSYLFLFTAILQMIFLDWFVEWNFDLEQVVEKVKRLLISFRK